ncbi:hypothetical protein GF380_04080 [Candidatus Uhrbacteria bacterium]|nr:hypothetical protein [Candidatus Uhrbacteria bacterium]MBD3284262.1 hypothetical protein [Candidatus Uhrbacteria bacterium]
MRISPIFQVLYLLPWLMLLAGFGWVVMQRFPPSGTVTFDLPFDGTSAWMDPFLPAERTSSPGLQEGGWRGQRIYLDPVYSAARLPGVFDEVEIMLEYRPLRQPFVEFGLLRDETTLGFEFEPIWFEPLQSSHWIATEESGRQGYVRQGEHPALLGTSAYPKLAVWHATATALEMKDPASDLRRTEVSLRGSHDFYALPSEDQIRFTFELQDSNRSKGRDTVVIQLLHQDEVLQTDAVGIGGSQDARMGRVIEHTIERRGLAPGVYRVQLIAEDDVFIRSIATPSRRWVVGPRVSFGDLVGYKDEVQPGVAWTDSRHLVLETFHQEGLQVVSLGEQSVELVRTHEVFELNRSDADTIPKQLVAPHGDLRVVGDGWFAFEPKAFFAPHPRRLTSWTDPEAEGIDAILTPYTRPEPLEDGWYRTSVNFDIDPRNDHLRFAVSAPNIETRGGAVDIRHVRLTYRRPPLSGSEWWRVLKMEIMNALRRKLPNVWN